LIVAGHVLAAFLLGMVFGLLITGYVTLCLLAIELIVWKRQAVATYTASCGERLAALGKGFAADCRKVFCGPAEKEQRFKVPCPNCGKPLNGPRQAIGKFVKCPECNTSFVMRPPGLADEPEKPRRPRNYGWLQGIVWIYFLLGCGALAFGVTPLAFGLVRDATWGIAPLIVACVVIAVVMFGTAELILLFLDMREDTRRTANYLQELCRRGQR
jgi:hypothetical protein